MITRSEEDFGFSFYTQEEMQSKEKQLSEQLQKTQQKLSNTLEDANRRIDEMRNSIMPFLNNLLKDPTKQWMLWPNRAKQVQSFIDKINQI